MLGLGYTETSVGTSLSLEKCGKADSICKWDKLVSTEIYMEISTEFTPVHLPVPLRVYSAFMTNFFLDPEFYGWLWGCHQIPDLVTQQVQQDTELALFTTQLKKPLPVCCEKYSFYKMEMT